MGSSMGMLRSPRGWEFQDKLDGDGIEEGGGDVITREIPSVSIHKLVKLNFFWEPGDLGYHLNFVTSNLWDRRQIPGILRDTVS